MVSKINKLKHNG